VSGHYPSVPAGLATHQKFERFERPLDEAVQGLEVGVEEVASTHHERVLQRRLLRSIINHPKERTKVTAAYFQVRL
jgi:hypothetical protein